MGAKRPRESDDSTTPAAKKPRKGFRVGPGNLPDGPWKRKVDKIKKDLIHKAKVKKAYGKIKAAEQANPKSDTAEGGERGDEDLATSPQFRPERQAMLDDEEEGGAAAAAIPPAAPSSPTNDRPARHRKPKPRKFDYFAKAAAEGERKKAEAEARAREIQRRNEEREQKMAERQRFRKAMAKARTPGQDGKRRLGRESGLLLEKVKQMVADGK
ncbi:hypothetical protein F4778DRAFT_786122 [Xylariomycetidae sp. FL2044]|nr:hypothetical protein F4778DRAFT_786122 [Xylariomycetidae sp. FL2044]